MEVINKEALKKFLKIKPEDWNTPDERWRPESEFWKMVEAMPTEEPACAWIPITYNDVGILQCQLPEDGEDVIITLQTISDSGTGFIVSTDKFWHDGNYYGLEDYDLSNVIAWMPFPKPYKER